MANPSFNGTDLFTEGAQEFLGSPTARMYIETMPGADGEFVQPHGTGGRTIMVRGILSVTGEASAADADAALVTALSTVHALVDGRTVGDYIGTDGTTRGDCMLMSYEVAGNRIVTPEGATYGCLVFAQATIRELTP